MTTCKLCNATLDNVKKPCPGCGNPNPLQLMPEAGTFGPSGFFSALFILTGITIGILMGYSDGMEAYGLSGAIGYAFLYALIAAYLVTAGRIWLWVLLIFTLLYLIYLGLAELWHVIFS